MTKPQVTISYRKGESERVLLLEQQLARRTQDNVELSECLTESFQLAAQQQNDFERHRAVLLSRIHILEAELKKQAEEHTTNKKAHREEITSIVLSVNEKMAQASQHYVTEKKKSKELTHKLMVASKQIDALQLNYHRTSADLHEASVGMQALGQENEGMVIRIQEFASDQRAQTQAFNVLEKKLFISEEQLQDTSLLNEQFVAQIVALKRELRAVHRGARVDMDGGIPGEGANGARILQKTVGDANNGDLRFRRDVYISPIASSSSSSSAAPAAAASYFFNEGPTRRYVDDRRAAEGAQPATSTTTNATGSSLLLLPPARVKRSMTDGDLDKLIESVSTPILKGNSRLATFSFDLDDAGGVAHKGRSDVLNFSLPTHREEGGDTARTRVAKQNETAAF